MKKSFEQKSREHFNREADDYDDSFDGRTTERYKILLLEEIRVEPHGSVLDVGCGNGRFLKQLSERCAIDGYGVDIAEKMVENARKNCPGMTFEVSGCECTPFPDVKFDIVTVCVALHHFPNLGAFAKEMNRVLKSGGRVYIADGRLPAVVRQIFNLFVPLSRSGDVKVYSLGKIRSAFEAHGFEMTEFKKKGVYPILVELRKR